MLKIIPERLREAHWKGYHSAVSAGATKHSGKPLTTRAVPKSGEGARPSWAAVMNWLQAFAGSPPPVTFFIDWPSSLPNQTPVVRLDV